MNIDLVNSYKILAKDEFVSWNEESWSVKATRHEFSDPKDRVSISAVLYQNRHGHYVQPPLNFYTPVAIETADLHSLDNFQFESAWVHAFAHLVGQVKSRGLSSALNLPPGLMDVRPFAWEGLSTEVRYTYTAKFPLGGKPTHAVRKAINKSSKQGLQVISSTDYSAIAECLTDTGDRKGFSYRLTAAKLASLAKAVGPSNLLTHVVTNSLGDVKAGGARLVSEGGIAIDWVQGTHADALPLGAAQAIVDRVLADSQGIGAIGFDYGGANIKSVAKAKASWNMSLTPYYSVSPASLKSIYRMVRRTRFGRVLP